MTNKEAVNWIINLSADIGKSEHCELWHYEQALYEIREILESAQQWIPVTKRLPEEKVEVLVTVEVDGKKYIENGMLSGINHGQWETIYDKYEIDVYGRNRNSRIIAWMPLPEPYSMEMDK